jgi:hypothetical protein
MTTQDNNLNIIALLGFSLSALVTGGFIPSTMLGFVKWIFVFLIAVFLIVLFQKVKSESL